MSADQLAVGIEACDCLTPFGDAAATAGRLLAGHRALELTPVLGRDGGDRVPLALTGPMDETVPPRWLPGVRALAAGIPGGAWGSSRSPVVATSSNFAVGSLYAFMGSQDARHLAHATPSGCVEQLAAELGWGPHVHVFSHACVSAHLGLAHAARLLHAGLAGRVLVFSFDFISPFVAGGFHSLKILNGQMPAPFAARDTGSIGLGDGAAFAVLSREPASFRIAAHALHNEMFHFTGNRADGSGFDACAAAIGVRGLVPARVGEGPRDGHARGRTPGGRGVRAPLSRGAPRRVERQPRPHARQLRPCRTGGRPRRRCAPAGSRERWAACAPASPNRSHSSRSRARASPGPCWPQTHSAAPMRRCSSPMIERFIHALNVELLRPGGDAGAGAPQACR